ncbi:hypothetical protein EAX62_00705 [Tessaracoccus antarcticus]|uniref:Uncharacterized protein n=1 Tax=Tessaracoccus antarcticus TaxID=2479848 RepID=A0A3M0GAB7_9ACTN|nr:hypothetical protein EAX62_00705 [Tessaracoccus antarcticus]
MTQSDQTPHLHEVALAELDVANRHLSDAGRTIDELRSDVLALASRVDAARAEAEAFRHELGREHSGTAALRGQVDIAAVEREELQQRIAGLEAHVARLKKQLERPGRLMVKKALRRGQYAKPEIS